MSAFHAIAAVPLCRIGYFVADVIESIELRTDHGIAKIPSPGYAGGRWKRKVETTLNVGARGRW